MITLSIHTTTSLIYHCSRKHASSSYHKHCKVHKNNAFIHMPHIPVNRTFSIPYLACMSTKHQHCYCQHTTVKFTQLPLKLTHLLTHHICPCQVLLCIFFGLCVLNDLIGSETVIPNKRSFLQKLRDGLLTTLVVPMGVVSPYSVAYLFL